MPASKEEVMIEKVAIDGSTTLIQNFGLVGVLLVAIGVLVWLILDWFKGTIKEQRKDFTDANAVQRKDLIDIFDKSIKNICDSVKETLELYRTEGDRNREENREYRAEQLAESKAMREMLQVCMNKLAIIKLVDEDKKTAKEGK